jgi:hypothetical protein
VIHDQPWTCNTSQMPWTLALFVCHTPSKIVCSICCWFCKLFTKFDVSPLFPCWNFRACPLSSGTYWASFFVGNWTVLPYVGSLHVLTWAWIAYNFATRMLLYLFQSQNFLQLPCVSDMLLHPLKTKINVHNIYKDSVYTSQRTECASVRKTNQLMLYRKIMAVYCKNRTEHMNTLCEQNAEFLMLNLVVCICMCVYVHTYIHTHTHTHTH